MAHYEECGVHVNRGKSRQMRLVCLAVLGGTETMPWLVSARFASRRIRACLHAEELVLEEAYASWEMAS